MERAPLVCAVDDDQALCESLDGLLRSAGFAVRTFLSAEDLLQWSASHAADCFILDFAMPGMNGLELRRALSERGIAVPVIFATAVGHDEVWDQLTSCGAFAVFAKPLDADALLAAVQRAVAGRGPAR
jgi:FixJ family two-component response regulator